MKYMKLPLTSFESFYHSWLSNPFACRLNLLPENGTMLVAQGENRIELSKVKRPYKIIKTYHGGGTIVVFDDGITLFDINRDMRRPKWRESLVDLLETRGLHAENTGNDVTVDGYKIAGYAETRMADTDYFQYGIHISMHVDVNEINHICQKPMKKIPRGLADFGLTREEVLKALEVEDTHGHT